VHEHIEAAKVFDHLLDRFAASLGVRDVSFE
jgi:hypothetical protein